MIDVILGLQWGDEGKGKIADFLTPSYDVVARFQGGPNAGHSLEMNGKKHVLNTIPSGIFHEKCINLIGNGVVIDPVRLKEEISRTEAAGAPVRQNLYISKKAHIILPCHKLLDAASEWSKGDKKIGSTLRGIGPTYKDKFGRSGLRAGDIFLEGFEQKYQETHERSMKLVEFIGFDDFDLQSLETEFFESVEYLRGFNFVNSEYFINEHITIGKKILAEGAQGSMLDVDFGSYPYVTSSNTITGGVCVGLGVAPSHIRNVKGIFKAYCTRVGGGPFPTELDNATGQLLRDKGHEYGATTGRPRRTGWIDLVALKYAIMLNGVNELVMMKSDILSGFDTIKAAESYKIGGQVSAEVPFEVCETEVEPVYREIVGWNEDLSVIQEYQQLPDAFKNYHDYLETFLKTPIPLVSVGPDRVQTIVKR
jgi:adenylosuccinate synthase